VAAARAADTESENPLINDPFARIFVDTAGAGVWNWYEAPELPAEVVEAEPELPLRMRSLVDYFASRTAFFDTFFLDATRAGIRQVVILAAGLDARAWRLPWPDGTTVYELDQPRVLDFKASTLAEHGAEPACNRVGVPVDLRQDWPTALQQAGFDASSPSAWSAEGLMMYLPAAAEELLFNRVHGLTATGSRIAVEALGPNFADPETRARQRERMERVEALAQWIDARVDGQSRSGASGPQKRRAVVLRGTRRRRRLVAPPRLGGDGDSVGRADGGLWPRGSEADRGRDPAEFIRVCAAGGDVAQLDRFMHSVS
jgi:methyltransferase (TIGR00027 family)